MTLNIVIANKVYNDGDELVIVGENINEDTNELVSGFAILQIFSSTKELVQVDQFSIWRRSIFNTR